MTFTDSDKPRYIVKFEFLFQHYDEYVVRDRNIERDVAKRRSFCHQIIVVCPFPVRVMKSNGLDMVVK